VAETVPTRLPFEFENLGEQKLKGFNQPVRTFLVRLQPGEILPAPEALSTSSTSELKNDNVLSKFSPELYEALTGERLEIPDMPSIAVLPFQNMSGDAEQEHFADGLSEDIITFLSRQSGLVVIARTSTFVYKGHAVDVRQIGKDLGVGHVLEGSIRKSGNRLRITAQLVETQGGNHVWAERYDRELDDIFDIQDEISRKIVVELQVKLGRGEFARNYLTGTKNIEAWELTHRALPLTETYIHSNVITAQKLVKKALELDPDYAMAWAELGWTYWEESVNNWSADPEHTMQLAFEAAQKSILADANNPTGYSLLGNVYMVRGDTNQAIELCEKSVDMAPSDSVAAALLANVLLDSGHLLEGIQNIKKALRLCPFPPAWYFSILGIGYHLSKNNEAAIMVFKHMNELELETNINRAWLASALVEEGRIDEARKVSKEILDIDPKFSALNWAESFTSKTHVRLKENMLAAGFLK